MKPFKLIISFLSLVSTVCVANQQQEPITNNLRPAESEMLFGHLKLISDSIDDGALDAFIGEWNTRFHANEVVCVDANCEMDGYDYAKMALQCAAYGTSMGLTADRILKSQIAGPFLGHFIRNRLILISIGLGPHAAGVIALSVFAAGCGSALWETKNAINKEIQQCRKDLQSAQESQQNKEMIQEILHKLDKLNSFNNGLDRGSR